MEQALSMMKLIPNRFRVYLKCAETGEVASLNQWADRVSSQTLVKAPNVRKYLHESAKSNKTAYGLHFVVVEEPDKDE